MFVFIEPDMYRIIRFIKIGVTIALYGFSTTLQNSWNSVKKIIKKQE